MRYMPKCVPTTHLFFFFNKFQQAQVSGAVSEAKLKQMKKGLNKLEKEKQKVMDKVSLRNL